LGFCIRSGLRLFLLVLLFLGIGVMLWLAVARLPRGTPQYERGHPRQQGHRALAAGSSSRSFGAVRSISSSGTTLDLVMKRWASHKTMKTGNPI